jgi:PTH1 family peptidyl-tRNA hydrolase
MLMIVGLGNPGPQYARQRHNVGFLAVDAIHQRHKFAPWRRRFQGETSEGELGGERTLLLKPQTFMNESGRSVQDATRFYKLAPSDIVVIHDEVDLPPGKTRMKAGGGVAGHNGLRSIGAAIGPDFRRLRIGVGHPGVKELVAGNVLHDFSKAETAWLEPLIDSIADNAALLAAGKDASFANRLHSATAEPVNKKTAAGSAATKNDPVTPAKAEPRPASPATKPEGPLARGLRKLFGR